MKTKYFEWIAECCKLLGKNITYGAILCEDTNWLAAWTDGMDPESAVKEFKEVYPNGYPPEIEEKYGKL